MSPQRRVQLLAWSIFAFTLLIRLPLLDVPLERDEGEYAYIAWRLSFGELPYLDWFDQKPPAVFWTYRLALTLPFDDVVSIHFAAALFAAGTAVVLFVLARRFLGDAAATLAAIVLALLSADPAIQGSAANTEIFMLLPLVAATTLFVRSIDRRPDAMFSGLLVGMLLGLASAYKQVAVAQWPLLVLCLPLLLNGSRRWARTARFAAWSALGGLAVWLAISLYFAARGGLGVLVDAVLLHNLEYVGALDLDQRADRMLAALGRIGPSQLAAWVLAACGVVVAVVRRRGLALLMLGWLVASQIAVGAGGHYFPHYFQQLLPPIALGVATLADELSGISWLRARPLASIALIGLLAAAPPGWSLTSHAREEAPADVARRIYPGNSFDVMPEIAAVLREITLPDDSVFIFGAEPEVLFYARRRSASRYIFLFPLYGPFADAAERQREVIREITEQSPKAVFLMPNTLFYSPDAEQGLTRWIMDHTDRSYVRHTSIWRDGRGRRHVVPTGIRTPSNAKELGAVLLRR